MMYTKNSPYIEPLDHAETTSHNEALDHVSNINPAYSKPQGTQSPLIFIIIFSGGTKTEKKYFSPILNHPEKFPSLKLMFEPDDILLKQHKPRVFTTAYAIQDLYSQSQVIEHPDQYFIVTDVDLFMPHLITEMPVCKSRGIGLIISNPCFEVWTYYSQYSDKFVNFTPPAEFEQLSHELKLYVHGVDHPRVYEVTAFYKMEDNIQNSVRNYQEDENGIPCRYSTSMHILATILLPFVQHVLPPITAVNP